MSQIYFPIVAAGCALQAVLFSIYVINARLYRGIAIEKLQYYTTANIPLATAAIYAMALIRFRDASAGDPPPAFLNFFFVEWTISAPLIVINIGRVLHIRLYKYFVLSSAAILMILFGFLAHTLPRPAAFGAFAAGATCYLFVFTFLLWVYYRRNAAMDTGTDGCIRSPDAPLTIRVVRRLLVAMSCVWSLYPVGFLLYMFTVIDTAAAITMFVVLDILSKGIFTATLLGYYDSVYRQDSFLQHLIRPLRIVPHSESAPIPSSPPRIQIKVISPSPIKVEDI